MKVENKLIGVGKHKKISERIIFELMREDLHMIYLNYFKDSFDRDFADGWGWPGELKANYNKDLKLLHEHAIIKDNSVKKIKIITDISNIFKNLIDKRYRGYTETKVISGNVNYTYRLSIGLNDSYKLLNICVMNFRRNVKISVFYNGEVETIYVKDVELESKMIEILKSKKMEDFLLDFYKRYYE